MFKLVCLITSVKVQTKFVNHRNLEGNCIYIFITILSFKKTETTPIFNCHSRLKQKKQIGLGWVRSGAHYPMEREEKNCW